MDQQFVQNRKLPGENGFQYDVQAGKMEKKSLQLATGTGDTERVDATGGFRGASHPSPATSKLADARSPMTPVNPPNLRLAPLCAWDARSRRLGVRVDFQVAEGTGDWDSDEESEERNSDEE
eukprot:1175996-Prorocentrum_minimum.AAC.1